MKRIAILLATAASVLSAAETHQAMGVKIGEVTENSAIIWTRVTAKSERVARSGNPPARAKGSVAPKLPEGVNPDTLEGAVPGAAGRVRIRYASREDLAGAKATPWAAVTEKDDFAHSFRITGLQPAMRYYFASEVEGFAPVRGDFHTAPTRNAAATVTFTVITGQMYQDLDDPEGYRIYESMLKLAPDFIVPTGDNVYYDNEPPLTNSIAVARYHWQRMFSLPRLVAFYSHVPAYFEKDDHDTYFNDSWPSMVKKQVLPFTFADGQRIFLQQVPMGDRTWRTARWGKALEIWMPEGRDFRSPNDAPDGPGKTIWGEEQKRWLKQSIAASDATWRVLVMETPIVGPDRGNKGDNHANEAFSTEGNEFRQWAKANLPKNFFVVTGDRHWQYHSVHPQTGLHEFSCGPASDQHAGGSPGENPEYHRFHRVQGGFISVQANPETISFRFHDVNGKVVYKYDVAAR